MPSLSPDPIFTLVAAALLIEAAIGYPAAIFRTIKHPVVWAGALIAALDANLNRPRYARLRGAAALVALLLAAGVSAAILAAAIQAAAPGWLGLAILALFGSTLLAQRSLNDHVAAVAAALPIGLHEARAAVSQIVGRDPEWLDHAAISRAAIESLAENFADGVVAPAFWGCALGLPGMALYKAVNTADSMIGHRTPRHLRFGWAAARLDDFINLPASRLAAFWLILAAALLPSASAARAWRAVIRDARLHRSPNAGWPEAAMAGALGLRLAGPRSYGGVAVHDAWMGDGRADATANDIIRALRLYRLACAFQIAAVALLAATT